MRELYGVGRILGVDVGERRIGVAVSDPTGLLARPLAVLHTTGLERDAVDLVAAHAATFAADGDAVGAIVVGMPRRLDGTPTDMTPRVQRFAERLGQHVGVPVHLQDERLTSHEAESRLARHERDWRERKKTLDAVAAAIILQDYLDMLHEARGVDGHADIDEPV